MSDMTPAKPFSIAKRTVWEAYQQVKANRGAAGIDDETIAMFEQDLPKNLYKLWNRMSSGVGADLELSRRADVRVTRRLLPQRQRLQGFGLLYRGSPAFRHRPRFWITFQSAPTHVQQMIFQHGHR